MHINLRCSVCGEFSPVSYGTLFAIWKEGYDRMAEENRPDAFVTAEIRCLCGHTESFDTPMFQYTFGTMFEELMALLEDN